VISDEELMAIYHETVRSLYAYVSRRTGGQRELAEDIVQETYIRAWDHWHRRKVRQPLAWLKTVARNLLASHFRRLQTRSLDQMNFDPAAEVPDLNAPVAVAWVQWGLARLKKGQARILESFYFDELPVREIAREWKLSERAVEGRLRRARQALRRQLERAQRARGGH
jgi:RNA polymerase sigma-70 factor (ECF subfamily)